jgi:hypothetical protein
MRFFSHARTTRREQRGYILVAAIAMSIVYFGLMQLMMIDSSRALREAQRFRSRIVASTLAESAAELAAAGMVKSMSSNSAKASDDQGSMDGQLHLITHVEDGRVVGTFELIGDAVTAGVQPVKANVRVQGRIQEPQVMIDYTFHSQ